MKNKDKILKIIEDYSCWITTKQIFETLAWTLDKTTVYRNVEKLLTECKIIEDFNKTWEKIYSLEIHHHHHFTCNNCEKKKNIWCFFEKELQRLEKEQNIIITNHSFLLNGLCDECKK